MIQRWKHDNREAGSDRVAARTGRFRSYREFLIYLGWLRLFRKVHPESEEELRTFGNHAH